MILLSSFSDSAVLVILAIYMFLAAILSFVLNIAVVNLRLLPAKLNKIIYWLLLYMLSLILVVLILFLMYYSTGKGLIEH